jgi:CHRD domain-containing protein
MKQRWYRWVPISAAFFVFSLTSAYAEITAKLETPAAGSSASGIALVRGWAFAGNASPVTVTLRVDGVTLSSFPIECCSARQDVQNSNPGAPLETGFGATVNYGDISAGPHVIGVEVSATGETTKVIDFAVVVVRPGNVPLVSTFDLTNATCSNPQPDSILINNVSVSGSGGSPTVTNVRAQYQTAVQGLVITEASGGPALTNFKSNLNGSQEVPTPTSLNCTGTGTLTLNADNTITCSVTFSNLTGPAAAAHIHLSPPGVAGGIIIGLTLPAGGASPATCPTTTPLTPLTADQLTALRQGNLYFNVHTAANSNGECRGQIVAGP